MTSASYRDLPLPAGALPLATAVTLAFAEGPAADGRTLDMTAGKSLFSTRVAVPGQVSFPKWPLARGSAPR